MKGHEEPAQGPPHRPRPSRVPMSGKPTRHVNGARHAVAKAGSHARKHLRERACDRSAASPGWGALCFWYRRQLPRAQSRSPRVPRSPSRIVRGDPLQSSPCERGEGEGVYRPVRCSSGRSSSYSQYMPAHLHKPWSAAKARSLLLTAATAHTEGAGRQRSTRSTRPSSRLSI